LYLLEDVGHGGMKMAGVEEVEETEVGDMTGIKGMNKDIRKKESSTALMCES
jgi:hypothetical protein